MYDTKGWVPPIDMPKEQADRVLAGLECGAKLPMTKEELAYNRANPNTPKPQRYCRKKPKAPRFYKTFPKRCALHMEPVTITHCTGLARRTMDERLQSVLLPGESLEDIGPSGTFDLEILYLKVRILRAMRADRDQQTKIKVMGEEAAMRPCTRKIRQEDGNYVTETTYTLTDYNKVINEAVNTLVKLENQQFIQKGAGLTSEESAKRANEYLIELRGKLSNVPPHRLPEREDVE